MRSIVFYTMLIIEVFALIYILIPTKTRKEITKSIFTNTAKELPYIKSIFILLFIFGTFFILCLNIFKVYSVNYNTIFTCTNANLLRKNLIFYFGMNTALVILFLLFNWSKVINWLVNNPIYINLSTSLMVTLLVTISRIWGSNEMTIFSSIMLIIQLLYLVRELKLIKNNINDSEYLFIIALYMGMTFYSSYTIFSKIITLFL